MGRRCTKARAASLFLLIQPINILELCQYYRLSALLKLTTVLTSIERRSTCQAFGEWTGLESSDACNILSPVSTGCSLASNTCAFTKWSWVETWGTELYTVKAWKGKRYYVTTKQGLYSRFSNSVQKPGRGPGNEVGFFPFLMRAQ